MTEASPFKSHLIDIGLTIMNADYARLNKKRNVI